MKPKIAAPYTAPATILFMEEELKLLHIRNMTNAAIIKVKPKRIVGTVNAIVRIFEYVIDFLITSFVSLFIIYSYLYSARYFDLLRIFVIFQA